MDWAKIAKVRLQRAEDEVRSAEQVLVPGNAVSYEKYRNALRELECARVFLRRVENQVVDEPEARGLFS